jgi:hypothetical protein
MFTLNGKTISCCGECPNNQEYPNAILGILPMKDKLPDWFLRVFAPTHRCTVSLDLILFDPAGRLILDPNRIPAWCILEHGGE